MQPNHLKCTNKMWNAIYRVLLLNRIKYKTTDMNSDARFKHLFRSISQDDCDKVLEELDLESFADSIGPDYNKIIEGYDQMGPFEQVESFFEHCIIEKDTNIYNGYNWKLKSHILSSCSIMYLNEMERLFAVDVGVISPPDRVKYDTYKNLFLIIKN